MHPVRDAFAGRRWWIPGLILLATWALAVVAWQITGQIAMLAALGWVGLILGPGVGTWILLPPNHKMWGRRLLLALIGPFLWALAACSAAGLIHSVAGFPAGDDVQIEGLFFSLLAGSFTPAVLHYAIAKLAGPLLFGRIWCGWACWFAAAFDLLPFRRSPGRLPGRWGALRYVHFGLSFAAVLLVWLVAAGSRAETWAGGQALLWFLAGSLGYYAAGIGLAVLLRDNRAFCKYVCPVTVPLKMGASYALLKVQGDARRCEGEGACVRVCPMDIRITDYVQSGRRVLPSECILCQECIYACPHQTLILSFGRDHGGAEELVVRATARRGAGTGPVT